MNAFDQKYSEYACFFEQALKNYCDGMDFKPSILSDSMKYSLLLGGKRLRPVLFLAALDTLGGDWKNHINFAIALEFIHTYSLIHDDLPAMDNDDFRRGMPSSHKKFGEGNAILAGDALLNTAYSILFKEATRGSKYLCAARYLCDAAGAYGMIAGQSADLLYGNQSGSDDEWLDFIYENKTAKLIMAPFAMAALLQEQAQWKFEQYGKMLGYLFQLTDDILDVKGESKELGKTVGKDEASGKLTSIRLYGLAKSELKADLITEKCHALLEGLPYDTTFFHKLTDFVRTRRK